MKTQNPTVQEAKGKVVLLCPDAFMPDYIPKNDSSKLDIQEINSKDKFDKALRDKLQDTQVFFVHAHGNNAE
ncbi:hypothetical protein [Candidatus Trichorickettsia mobilis]|uniref:hypothetical protein n=1 Tax=Candidatus Trichorickettsia mobilis TaxID=1346319 RepID=UPI00292E8931|nr:hypothetical protein [Candidatus Trichorickettsia mobilis]